MKPLYLQGRSGMRVLLDEPALRVAMLGRAATLYPLQRISRVIASGPVEWSTAALLACAERGITITFLCPDGAIQAYLFGESTQREGLFCRLQDLLDRPDWHERYDNWRRAMASRARLKLIRQLDWDLKQTPSPERLEALLTEFKQHYVSASVCRFIEKRLRGLLSALVAELLAQAGLTAERMRCLDERLDLPGDLVRLLLWELQVPVLELLDRQARATGTVMRFEAIELVRLFERYSERLQRLGRTVLDRLHGWLVELCV